MSERIEDNSDTEETFELAPEVPAEPEVPAVAVVVAADARSPSSRTAKKVGFPSVSPVTTPAAEKSPVTASTSELSKSPHVVEHQPPALTRSPIGRKSVPKAAESSSSSSSRRSSTRDKGKSTADREARFAYFAHRPMRKATFKKRRYKNGHTAASSTLEYIRQCRELRNVSMDPHVTFLPNIVVRRVMQEVIQSDLRKDNLRVTRGCVNAIQHALNDFTYGTFLDCSRLLHLMRKWELFPDVLKEALRNSEYRSVREIYRDLTPGDCVVDANVSRKTRLAEASKKKAAREKKVVKKVTMKKVIEKSSSSRSLALKDRKGKALVGKARTRAGVV